MSWSKTAEFLRFHLSNHHKIADAKDDLTKLPWFRSLHLREEQYRHHIDAICQKFIFSGNWPSMSKTQSHLVSYRLAWAIKFALSLETPFTAAPQTTVSFPKELDQAQILHWLLIDTWSLSPKADHNQPAVLDNVAGVLAASQEVVSTQNKNAEKPEGT